MIPIVKTTLGSSDVSNSFFISSLLNNMVNSGRKIFVIKKIDNNEVDNMDDNMLNAKLSSEELEQIEKEIPEEVDSLVTDEEAEDDLDDIDIDDELSDIEKDLPDDIDDFEIEEDIEDELDDDD